MNCDQFIKPTELSRIELTAFTQLAFKQNTHSPYYNKLIG